MALLGSAWRPQAPRIFLDMGAMLAWLNLCLRILQAWLPLPSYGTCTPLKKFAHRLISSFVAPRCVGYGGGAGYDSDESNYSSGSLWYGTCVIRMCQVVGVRSRVRFSHLIITVLTQVGRNLP